MQLGDDITEEEAGFLLRALVNHAQMDFQRRMAPFFSELAKLEARKPHRPVGLPDGRVVVYDGPIAAGIEGPYRVPDWLREIASTDFLLMQELRRYRRKNAPPPSDHPSQEGV